MHWEIGKLLSCIFRAPLDSNWGYSFRLSLLLWECAASTLEDILSAILSPQSKPRLTLWEQWDAGNYRWGFVGFHYHKRQKQSQELLYCPKTATAAHWQEQLQKFTEPLPCEIPVHQDPIWPRPQTDQLPFSPFLPHCKNVGGVCLCCLVFWTDWFQGLSLT